MYHCIPCPSHRVILRIKSINPVWFFNMLTQELLLLSILSEIPLANLGVVRLQITLETTMSIRGNSSLQFCFSIPTPGTKICSRQSFLDCRISHTWWRGRELSSCQVQDAAYLSVSFWCCMFASFMPSYWYWVHNGTSEVRQAHTHAISSQVSLYMNHLSKSVTMLSMGLLHFVSPLWKYPYKYTEGCAF